ncbi:A24 family peptidase [Burkholderia vietnamiensis]|jgi:leader peptidase (prepilin peptidase)/N-methyltransferase|uniref:Prepilin leader peptidase/N-methyltransferase n=2 Tax=Burkholderia vietnamiensis TaxID=60552 RepID=A4JBB0_BURVG|nr:MULTISPECIES: A24 family peptidase [Burkholderia]ABO53563.1 type 4 prepilin peptidase 1, Aspartic peptidase, MEROPS family A24A [Burkholderia vietnamiensis G4]AFJ84858.1 Leader peptidase (Prepilin peptidase) / N-methyltransferase [Burkholderia sp. KJ006]AJY06508.1 type IV leader peptidase family protein [Burkholderia vietnamiensis LMG 10929]AOK09195.1 peptidase A24 [Burkholderia vietnamiensis]AVR15597.1 prepilin peptidase [Burkholderia vietnamiensis]
MTRAPMFPVPDSPAGTLLALALLPPAVQYAFAVVIGLCVGSFINVVAHRVPVMMQRAWRAEIAEATGNADAAPDDGYPQRYDLWRPRSACPHCGHVLRAWENVPLLSYVMLRGRCRQCGHAIGIRYPLVELAGALLAAGSLAAFGPTGAAIAAFGLCAALLAMSAIDIRTGYLPDSMTLPLLWAGLALNLAGMFTSLQSAVIGAMSGYLFLWSIYWLFRWLRGIEGIGFGDLKLLAALGAWMGWAALPQVVLFAAVTGAIVGLVATWRGRMRFEEPIPFGPFLAAGGVATLFFGTPFYSALGG